MSILVGPSLRVSLIGSLFVGPSVWVIHCGSFCVNISLRYIYICNEYEYKEMPVTHISIYEYVYKVIHIQLFPFSVGLFGHFSVGLSLWVFLCGSFFVGGDSHSGSFSVGLSL